MSKHTPGPWRIEPQRPSACEIDLFDERNRGITSCKADHFDPLDGNYSREWCDANWPRNEEAQANARLIAKAPDLYAALDRLVRERDPDIRNFPRQYDEARALLAEIDGEER